MSAVKTQPNRKIGPFRIYLNFYNLAQTIQKDTSWIKKVYFKIDTNKQYYRLVVDFLKNIVGEPPVKINHKQLSADARNIENIYYANGYLKAKCFYAIEPIVKFKKNTKRANVIFYIDENAPYIFSEKKYVTSDKSIIEIIEKDTASLIKVGSPYNENALSEERIRIANLLRNHGYFRIMPANISYVIDTFNTNTDTAKVSDITKITNNISSRKIKLEVILPDSIFQYTFDTIALHFPRPVRAYSEYNYFNAAYITPEERKKYYISKHKLQTNIPYYFLITPRMLKRTNLNSIIQRIYFKPGDIYKLKDIRKTQQFLLNMGLFKNVTINLTPNDSSHTINCQINMIFQKRYDFRIGIESFLQEDSRIQNNNFPGIGGNVIFSDRNLLGQAERLDFRFSGNISFYRPAADAALQSLYQLDSRLSVNIPRFLLLSNRKHGLINFQPSTNISVNYNKEVRQEFERSSTGINYRYIWFNEPFSQVVRSDLSVLSASLIESKLTPNFLRVINSLPATVRVIVLQDFTPRFSTKSNFNLTYNPGYGLSRTKKSLFLRFSTDLGGNIPFLIDWIAKSSQSGDGSIKDGLVNNQFLYGQFYRLLAEAKIFKPFGKKAEIIGRLVTGRAGAWNHSAVTPFENRFFGGGTNGVRGWLSNTLGPGTFRLDSIFSISPGGEILLESNIEFRYDLFGPLEIALFLDAGNVWFSKRSTLAGYPSKTLLSNENLEIGLAGGIGFRFDFSFLLLRLDIAQQLYAPDIKGWVIRNNFFQNIGGGRLQFNFGIGYPF
jgi:outer membrane protein assembly factor BamA